MQQTSKPKSNDSRAGLEQELQALEAANLPWTEFKPKLMALNERLKALQPTTKPLGQTPPPRAGAGSRA